MAARPTCRLGLLIPLSLHLLAFTDASDLLSAGRRTSEQLLRQESQALQRKIDLVSGALAEVRQHRGAGPPQLGRAEHLLVLAEPAHRTQFSAARRSGQDTRGTQFLAARRSGKEHAAFLSSSSVKAHDGSRPTSWNFLDELKEWTYGGAQIRSIPQRNKLVLAAIEMVPPLGLFGMDRLYLGQPFLAVAKMLCFVGTFGVLGTVWSMFDAFVISANCLLYSRNLQQFGMAARFGSDDGQLQVAAAMGVLIVLSWLGHFIWAMITGYRAIQPGGRLHKHYEYLTQGPKASTCRRADLQADPFMTKSEAPANLKADPFMSQVESSPKEALHAYSSLERPHPGGPSPYLDPIPDEGYDPAPFVSQKLPRAQVQRSRLPEDEPVAFVIHSQKWQQNQVQSSRLSQASKYKPASSLGRWYRQDEQADFEDDTH